MMNYLRSFMGWETESRTASPVALPHNSPKLPKRSPLSEIEPKQKQQSKKKKKAQVEAKEVTTSPLMNPTKASPPTRPVLAKSDSAEGFIRVENKKKKRKSKKSGGSRNNKKKSANNSENWRNNANQKSGNRRNSKKGKKNKTNAKSKIENSDKPLRRGFVVLSSAPQEHQWMECRTYPPAPAREGADPPNFEVAEATRELWLQRLEAERQIQLDKLPVTLIPPCNEESGGAPIESYASLKDGETIEASKIHNKTQLFIGFDTELDADHQLLDNHLRAQATHGDFIEVWSSKLDDWAIAQIYECRNGKISARYCKQPAFKIVKRYDPTTWRPCRADPSSYQNYDRRDVDQKRLVKVFSEKHEKWMLGHVVDSSLKEGHLVRIRLLQHLNIVIDISLFSPYLIPLPKATSDELWSYIDSDEDRSATPPNTNAIHSRRTRRLKEIWFCKNLSKMNDHIASLFDDQKVSDCIFSFTIDEEFEFDASIDSAPALVACAEKMRAAKYPGLTFRLLNLRADFLEKLTKALEGRTVLRSLKLVGSDNHQMETFPLRLSGLVSLEMNGIQLSDEDFEQLLSAASEGGNLREISLLGVSDSEKKREIVQQLQKEFPLLNASFAFG